MDRRVLKEIILANELIDEGRLRELEALSVGSGSTLLETIVQGGYIREEKLLPLVAQRFGVDWVDLSALEEIDPGLYGDLPPALRACAGLLPLYRENGHVVVAVSDITEVELIDRLREATGWSIRLVYASQEKLGRQREILERGGAGSMQAALSTIGGEELGERSLEEMANEAPIIKLVNLMIMQAISEGASDIHIEPYERQATVRYRVDGVLRDTATYPAAQYPAIVSRVKIMADLDIAERRIPQDGRISLRLMDREYDLRVASVPVVYGEGVVMRILDKGSIMVGLGDLGFAEANLAEFHQQIAKPHGIVLVTGPTGSGKTTTLYATLSAIKSVKTKIITIEDPVEYQLDGINQIHVNPKVGLTFAAGLRSILRLDPDIIMVGEIRDTETAEIAIRASLTGHTVFSTLHTNDAPKRHHAAARHGTAALPDLLDAQRRAGAAAGALHLRVLSKGSVDRRHRGRRARGGGGRRCEQPVDRRRLRAVQRVRLQRPHGYPRAPAGRRAGAPAGQRAGPGRRHPRGGRCGRHALDA